jgi:hypothetical protein
MNAGKDSLVRMACMWKSGRNPLLELVNNSAWSQDQYGGRQTSVVFLYTRVEQPKSMIKENNYLQ